MGSGKKTVIAALVGNSTIGIFKFIAFAFSGSAAMLSEAIHSVADVSNQALLLLGIKRSEAHATEQHIYGYGAERYFWTLISAVGIFFLGCGVTVYHGIQSLVHGHEAHPGVWDYSILALGLIIEGWTLWIAIKGINIDRRGTPFFEFLKRSADPTPIAVLLEDFVACLGLAIAMVGIWLSQLLESPVPDGIASIVIGVLLGFVAIFLIYKNHGLIIGMTIAPEMQQEVLEFLGKRSSVERILDFKSRVLSAERFRLKMEIEFEGDALADKVLEGADLEELRAGFKDAEALRAYLRSFADRVVDELGDEIDRIETDLRKQFPGARHIDIEAD